MMVLRLQHVAPIVSPHHTTPDDRGATHWEQRPNQHEKTALLPLIFETKPPTAACWEIGTPCQGVRRGVCGLTSGAVVDGKGRVIFLYAEGHWHSACPSSCCTAGNHLNLRSVVPGNACLSSAPPNHAYTTSGAHV